MNTFILEESVQNYIYQDELRDPHKISLSKSPFPEVSSVELAQQVDSRQRAKIKLPTWYQTRGLIYPPKISIEQSSSEITAKYKADLLGPKAKMADLTGGMGVDAYYFSLNSQQLFHCEILSELSAIAQQNHQVLGANSITHINKNGLEWLEKQADASLDSIYLDPARRDAGKRVHKLEDCFPNVLEFQELLFKKTSQVCIKAAPLLDIHQSEKQLHHLRETHIVSINNDCKEILFILNAAQALDSGQDQIQNKKGIRRVCTAFKNGKQQTLSFLVESENSLDLQLGEIKKYLYEPDVSLLKAGAFKTVSSVYGIEKLHQHTHLYTSEEIMGDFMGKITEIQEIIPYSRFKKTKSYTEGAIVVSKNFPLKADELRKKHKISENPENHLYFIKDKFNDLVVVKSRLIPAHSLPPKQPIS